MVNTKDQKQCYSVLSMACFLYRQCRHRYHWMVCQHSQHEDQSMQCSECYVCQHCQHWCLWLLHNTVYRVMRCENCPLLCIKCIDSVDIDRIACIRDPCPVSTLLTYIVMMVWLKSPQSQLSKTFCGLKINWILRKLWGEMCGCVLYPQCQHWIALNALELLVLYQHCIDIYSNDGLLKSPQSQLSKTFCRLKIGWILKKLWAEMCGYVLYWQCQHR